MTALWCRGWMWNVLEPEAQLYLYICQLRKKCHLSLISESSFHSEQAVVAWLVNSLTLPTSYTGWTTYCVPLSWDETPAQRVSSSALWLCPIALSLALSLTGCLVRGCQTVCQPMASSLRGQSSRSSWGKPPPCRNSPFAYGCRAGREGRRGRKVERA